MAIRSSFQQAVTQEDHCQQRPGDDDAAQKSAGGCAAQCQQNGVPHGAAFVATPRFIDGECEQEYADDAAQCGFGEELKQQCPGENAGYHANEKQGRQTPLQMPPEQPAA